MATRNRTSESAPETTGFTPPARTVSLGGIPARVGRPRNNYEAWEPEIRDLYENLGDAFTYSDLPKCQSVASGLRREYGVRAVTSNIDKHTGVGTLHVQVPVRRDSDESPWEVDEVEIKAIKAKYAKK